MNFLLDYLLRTVTFALAGAWLSSFFWGGGVAAGRGNATFAVWSERNEVVFEFDGSGAKGDPWRGYALFERGSRGVHSGEDWDFAHLGYGLSGNRVRTRDIYKPLAFLAGFGLQKQYTTWETLPRYHRNHIWIAVLPYWASCTLITA